MPDVELARCTGRMLSLLLASEPIVNADGRVVDVLAGFAVVVFVVAALLEHERVRAWLTPLVLVPLGLALVAGALLFA